MKLSSTKSKILQAALGLLEKNGIKALSQTSVAKLVGIPQGQLTYHFPKRADLILGVSEIALDRVAEYLWKHDVDITGKSFEKLFNMVLENLTANSRIRALLGLVIEADENADVRAKLIEQGIRVRTLIGAALQLDPEEPEVTLTHASLLGFGILMFLNPEKKEMYKKHLFYTNEILKKHLKESKKSKTKRSAK